MGSVAGRRPRTGLGPAGRGRRRGRPRRRAGADGRRRQRAHDRRRRAELAPDASPTTGCSTSWSRPRPGRSPGWASASHCASGEHVDRDDVLATCGAAGDGQRRRVPRQRRRRAGRSRSASRTWTVQPGGVGAARALRVLSRGLHPAADRAGRPSPARAGWSTGLRQRVRSICVAAGEVVVEVGVEGGRQRRGRARSARPPRRGRASGG